MRQPCSRARATWMALKSARDSAASLFLAHFALGTKAMCCPFSANSIAKTNKNNTHTSALLGWAQCQNLKERLQLPNLQTPLQKGDTEMPEMKRYLEKTLLGNILRDIAILERIKSQGWRKCSHFV
jgi:hypothetical protein